MCTLIVKQVNKSDIIETKGEVIELLPNANFRIRLDNGKQIVAYTSGRMRKNRIRILVGDKVSIEMTPYDFTRGRVVHRN